MTLFRWENFLVLLVLILSLAGSVQGGGVPDKESVVYTDYGSFLGEYLSAGALRFYDNTEEMLRLAQFERALMRYRFLKGQIRGKRDYYGLINMVDLRLQFLKRQLHLRDFEVAAIPPRKARIPRAKPSKTKPPKDKSPPAKPGAAKGKTPGNASLNKFGTKPKPTVTIPPMVPQQATAPPVTSAPNQREVVTTTPKTQDEKAEEEKAKEKKKAKPAPPLSFWDKLKIRLHLRKRPE